MLDKVEHNLMMLGDEAENNEMRTSENSVTEVRKDDSGVYDGNGTGRRGMRN